MSRGHENLMFIALLEVLREISYKHNLFERR